MLFYNLLRVQKLAHETKKINLVNLLSAYLVIKAEMKEYSIFSLAEL